MTSKEIQLIAAFLMATALLLRYTNYLYTHTPLPVQTDTAVDETDMPFR
jgi:hypothetical protein